MFTYDIDENIKLKLINKQDADEIFRLTDGSREYLREWLPWLDNVTKTDDTKAFISSSLKGFAEEKSLTATVWYKGKLAGVASFNELDWSNGIAYIGYWLTGEYQGKGIMTKVAGALTDYAFRELNMNKVDIRAAEGNTKSRKIPERLGFTEEGRIRQAEWLYNKYVDHIVYGILKEEWQNKTKN